MKHSRNNNETFEKQLLNIRETYTKHSLRTKYVWLLFYNIGEKSHVLYKVFRIAIKGL
jgi:hypothetical protein